jgi:hypothetical protein
LPTHSTPPHKGRVTVEHEVVEVTVVVVEVVGGGQGFGEQVPGPWAIPP